MKGCPYHLDTSEASVRANTAAECGTSYKRKQHSGSQAWPSYRADHAQEAKGESQVLEIGWAAHKGTAHEHSQVRKAPGQW